MVSAGSSVFFVFRRSVLWLVLIFWTVAFFPKWFFITHTKLWEWRQLLGGDRFTHMQVLQGDELDTIVAISRSPFVTQSWGKIVIPPVGAYPLLSIAPMWRSVLGSSSRLVSPEEVRATDASLLVPVPAFDRVWSPQPGACLRQGCECPAWPVRSVQYWEVR